MPLAAILDVLRPFPLSLPGPCLDDGGEISRRLRTLDESLWMSILGMIGADL